jgi:hypothetical protein
MAVSGPKTSIGRRIMGTKEISFETEEDKELTVSAIRSETAWLREHFAETDTVAQEAIVDNEKHLQVVLAVKPKSLKYD